LEEGKKGQVRRGRKTTPCLESQTQEGGENGKRTGAGRVPLGSRGKVRRGDRGGERWARVRKLWLWDDTYED